jgi:hypothetical protein
VTLEEPMEQATLIEVKDVEQTLVLMDGRELSVDPGDITTAILWLPTTLLEISDTDDNRFSTSASKSMDPMKRFVRAGDERMNWPDPPTNDLRARGISIRDREASP